MKQSSCLVFMTVVLCFLIFISYFIRNIGDGLVFRLGARSSPDMWDVYDSTLHNNTLNSANYLRYLYPQIWTCPATRFKGKPGYFSQSGEDAALYETIFNKSLSHRDPGIFVELGALNGVTFSNTLFFERMFDWRGVLIEAQPGNARNLLRVDRKRTVKLPVGICSPPQTYIQMLVMSQALSRRIDLFHNSILG